MIPFLGTEVNIRNIAILLALITTVMALMDTARAVRPGEELDWNRLQQYLHGVLPELTRGEMEVSQFHGGHANLTYLLRFGEQEMVLRRPPFGRIAPGAHDMEREYRVLSRLYKYFSPAPRAYHYCADTEIIGAPFVLMERREGLVIRKQLPDGLANLTNAAERVTLAMLRAEADLHTLDVTGTELSSLGKPEGYLERQLAGWKKRWTLSKTEENDTMDRVLDKLGAKVPITQSVGVVHNDIKLDNCQFAVGDPDRVTALFDWDMTTLGDPLLDFATTLSYWPDPELAQYEFLPVFLVGDWPDKKLLRHYYREYTGFSLDQLPWYEALAYVRVAVIAQQLYRRFHDGATKDKRMAYFGESAKVMIQMAERSLEK